jgi:signal transduction histidine kinase/CheY-like chemotaxis protein
MPIKSLHSAAIKHYIVALVGIVLATAVRYLLGPILGASIPVVLYTVPVAISAIYGGFGPAVFATIISALIANFLFIQPYYSFRIEDPASFVIVITFLLVGAVLSFLGKRLKKLQLKAEQQAQLLRTENERKDQFLAMLAHELRNPLAGISTAGQLLKFAHLDQQRLATTSDVITRQVGHMTKLIDDLLDVSRLTRGLVIIDKQVVDMNDVVCGAIDQTQSLFTAKGHRLNLEMPGKPLCVYGDNTRLVQIVANLLGNSAKYTPAGGVITLAVRVDADQVELKIDDNGLGLSPKLLPHIFEPFVQAERRSDRSEGGLGLGLALVKEITHLHNGTITAHSAGLGLGSTFTLRLPHWKNAVVSNKAVSDQKAKPLVDDTVARKSLNLMVVEDNRDAAQGLATLLEQQGHAAVVAYNAKQALDMAHTDEFDAFLLDIGLPEVDGHELVGLLRQVPHLSNATFIAISGYGRDEDKERSIQAGFHYHFVKPVDVSSLMEVLRQITAAS